MFGGHEKSGTLWTSPHRGRSVCIDCSKEAERISKKGDYWISDSVVREMDEKLAEEGKEGR